MIQIGRLRKQNTEINEEVIEKKRNPLIDFLQSITIAIVLSIIIFSIVTPSEVDGSSMEPNFYNGERVYTDRLPQWFSETSFGKALSLDYNRGDIIVFNKPGMLDSLIKRVIGMPGDTVEIRNGNIYINDHLLQEYYLGENTYTKAGTFLKDNTVLTVPSDSFFVMGDNRAVSNDSRYIGFIKREWMQGKVIFRLWPLDKIGIIREGQFEIK